MASIDRRAFQHFDWLLFGLVWAVVAIGVANLYSATHAGAEGRLPAEFRRQLVAIALGAAAMGVVVLVDYRKLERWAPALYVGALILTASTLVFAPETRGNRSWLVYGPLSLQPAEFAKLGLILMMARYFQRHPPGRLDRLHNATVLVKEWQGDVVFLHEVVAGAADRSYGIQVAKLAGLPSSVIERAKLVLARLEQEERIAPKGFEDLPLFAVPSKAPHEKPESAEDLLVAALAAINPDDLSPREAMEALYMLKAKLTGTRKP